MPGKNRKSQKNKYHPFFDYSSDEYYDSSDFYDSDNDFYCYSSGGKSTTADGNNDNKETGSDSGLSLEKLHLKPRKKLLACSWSQWDFALPGIPIQQSWISIYS